MTTEVAIAILYQNQTFLMQLRDDIPGIVYPGQWGLFGGHIETGETPEIAIKRELVEEIGYVAPSLSCFGTYRDPGVIRYVFHGPLNIPPEEVELREGWDYGLLNIRDIHTGEQYSARAEQVRPLGKPHQQILLQFCQHQGWEI